MTAPLAFVPALVATLRQDGFAFVPGTDMLPLLQAHGLRDWEGFAASWDRLGMDRFMADGGRYRQRRHAAFAVDAGAILRKPHQPHWQSRDHNALNGGIARWFDPVEDAVAAGDALPAIIAACRALFGPGQGGAVQAPWHVEVHQFRIEARSGTAGLPTPEGMHRDGVDWVMVLMVRRRNVAEGDTRIAAPDGTPLGCFTLTDPGDAALLDDHRVAHGVTPVVPADPADPGFRDVLVVTFRAEVPQEA
jgi:hypothetical protein